MAGSGPRTRDALPAFAGGLFGLRWRRRAGGPGRALPERYGPATPCSTRFHRWCKQGFWARRRDALGEADAGAISRLASASVRDPPPAVDSNRGAGSWQGAFPRRPDDAEPSRGAAPGRPRRGALRPGPAPASTRAGPLIAAAAGRRFRAHRPGLRRAMAQRAARGPGGGARLPDRRGAKTPQACSRALSCRRRATRDDKLATIRSWWRAHESPS